MGGLIISQHRLQAQQSEVHVRDPLIVASGSHAST